MASSPKTIDFYCYGKPQPRGSKSVGARYNKSGQPVTKDGRVLTFARDDNEQSKSWMEQVRSAAAQATNGNLLIDGPVSLEVSFWFARPQGHYGSGRNAGILKDSAPRLYIQTPDIDKLVRAISDALTGVIWRDDKQVVHVGAHKSWSGDKAMAHIIVKELSPAAKDGILT